MNQQEKYAELFAAEAREHLAQMGRALVALEEEPGNRESLDAIFRSVHTIKGMAGAMGYDAATRLAHNIESVLDDLRADRRGVDPDLIDLLLDSTDLLDAIVAATVEGKKLPDPSVTVERLVLWRLADQATVASDVDKSPGTAAPPPSGPAPEPAARPRQRSGASRVRVDIRRLDALMNLMGELTIVRGRIRALAEGLDSEPLLEAVDEAGSLIGEMQTQVVESRMVPVWQIFDRFPRMVRDAARAAEKEVELEVSGKELELDRSLLDAIGDPLVHLLRNAVDHGIEAPADRQRAGKQRVGRIELSARRERSRVVIEVRDDGRGIDREGIVAEANRRGWLGEGVVPTDQELFRLMARPGFSTTREVTTLSGRGVGLNVVEDAIRSVGGSVELRSDRGSGTTIRLELPLTLVILPALVVVVGGQYYALPATFTRESFEANEADIEEAHGVEWVRWRDGRIPLTRLQFLFGNGSGDEHGGGAFASQSADGILNLVALEYGGERRAVSVDAFVGEEEIVVKSFDLPRGSVPVFSGATVRPDGQPALVIDVGRLG